MELVCKGVEMNTPDLAAEGVRVQVIGDRSRFSDVVNASLDRIESQTAMGEVMTLVLALNYSSRSEITAAVKDIAKRVAAGEISAEQIDDQLISQSLYTAAMPDPDLVIRTSGECRMSNFLMWQASYAELYFTEALWPDFDKAELDKALEAFA